METQSWDFLISLSQILLLIAYQLFMPTSTPSHSSICYMVFSLIWSIFLGQNVDHITGSQCTYHLRVLPLLLPPLAGRQTRGQWPFRSAGKRAMMSMASDILKFCKMSGRENLPRHALLYFSICKMSGPCDLPRHRQSCRPKFGLYSFPMTLSLNMNLELSSLIFVSYFPMSPWPMKALIGP